VRGWILPAPSNALNVAPCLVLVTCFAKALCVFPQVFTTEGLGLDVVDLNGWRYEPAFRAVTAQGLCVYPSIA